MEPRIYVACLASYNAGKLYGRWIDTNQDPDDIDQEIREMLVESPEPGAEEYAIHDYEDMPNLGESPLLDDVSDAAKLIAEHGALGKALIDHHCGRVESAKEDLEDNYCGAWSSVEEYAENYLEDTGAFQECGDLMRQYFDFERFARDLELGGDIWTIEVDGRIHVFHS